MGKKTKMWKIFEPMTKFLPQDYEEWLEGYELKGWYLKSFNGVIHRFEKGEPRKVKYCYDYQVKRKDEYETIFKDAGWECITCILGSYIWRKVYIDKKPEAFSDIESIIARNKRLIIYFILCAIADMSTMIVKIMYNALIETANTIEVFFSVLAVLFTIVGIVMICVSLKLIFANIKLRKQVIKS